MSQSISLVAISFLPVNEKRRSIKLRPGTDRDINLGIKNAEYHQQTFSDPFMILRVVGVSLKDLWKSSNINGLQIR
mgnify:CR=1 FL=1